MNEIFDIYLDRLKDGQTANLKEVIPADFLDVHEEELSFSPKVSIEYEAYLADEHLVIYYSASTKGFMPCSVCNKKVEFSLAVDQEYHTESLENFRARVFDASLVIREGLLLQVPPFIECNEGCCPERSSIAAYLKKPAQAEEKTHHPFADL